MTKSQPPSAQELRDVADAQHITQVEIAQAVGVSQSRISKFLSGAVPYDEELARDIATFLRSLGRAERQSPQTCTVLQRALDEVWDRTPEHAAALAKVIRSLRELSPRRLPGG